MRREWTLVVLVIVTVGLLATTAIKPYDRITWLMEVAPVRCLPADPVPGNRADR